MQKSIISILAVIILVLVLAMDYEQRLSDRLIPENPLVLKWLKVIQDTSSADKALLSSMEGNRAQTFNNALSAMAFILKDEKERAERILNFYAKATDKNNEDLALQNFFYEGEARGFYQTVLLHKEGKTGAYHQVGSSDRWMGDMAWLLVAYKYYERTYNSDRYDKIINLIKNLLISFYKPADVGGYIQHGWRKGDTKLHEDHGHPEGNIDCYAALKLCGEDQYAENIKKWVVSKLKNKKDLPLDLYTWRVLAFGKDYARLLDIPEKSPAYRKTLQIDNKKVVGFYHGAAPGLGNIWIDGVGHMACAFFYAGEEKKGNFYVNQLDTLLITRIIVGLNTKALPYTANDLGGYSWVDQGKGFTSCACWYIFAKNKFNPLTLTSGEQPTTGEEK